jgi:hypothetical protein
VRLVCRAPVESLAELALAVLAKRVDVSASSGATRGGAAAGGVELMDAPDAYLSKADRDDHEQARQDEQAQAFAVLGDELTTTGYAAWLRSEEEDE